MTFYSPQSYDPGFRLQDGTLLNAQQGNPKLTTEDQITATGSTVADAHQLRASVNVIATAAAGTGVVLPHAVPGLAVYVFNRGAASLTVYAQPPDTLDASVASVALAAAARCAYLCVTPGQWISTLMGATSA